MLIHSKNIFETMPISSACYIFSFAPVSFISSPHCQYDLLPSVSRVRFMDFSRTSTVVSTSLVSLFASSWSSNKNHGIRPSGVGSDSGEVKSGNFGQFEVFDEGSGPRTDVNGGDGNQSGSGGNNFGGGGGENSDEEDGNELGPVLRFEEVIAELNNRGVTLPSDMLAAAKTIGIRKLLLLRYLDLQGSVWPLGFLMKFCSMLRNRMLADPSFLFKVVTEVAIDFGCGTFAEVQKRGEDFWGEFELYAADMLVGAVVDVALVGLLAPYARIGERSISTGLFGRIQQACAALPSSVFEAERPGSKFTAKQRIAAYFYKGVLYGAVGFGCGLIGQGIANFIMNTKRGLNKSEDDVPVPPLVGSAALWGVFLAVSSNTRYQIVNGLEQLVEASPLAKRVPPVAMAFTVGVRFANNIYGGMQFVDWAKLSGVQ